MAEQIYMPDLVRNHLKNKMKGKKIGHLTVKNVLGMGKTAVTYDVEDEFGIPWALKIVTTESYGENAPFREIGRFSNVKDERFLVFPKEVYDWSLDLERVYSFICFKSRRVDGLTIKKFLESNTRFSLKTEVLRFFENLTIGLEELQRLGFSHCDLHDCNIMREVIGSEGPSPEIRYVIIDFSEAHPFDRSDEGISKDIEWFGKHLRTFSDVVLRRTTVSREDEAVANTIAHIPGMLNGTSPESMGISTAYDIYERFKSVLWSTEDAPRKLIDPFHPLSAENIGNESLLADLCFTKMWWASELQKNDNRLLIGPRGCGKTMIFRRHRLKTKAKANKPREIQDDPYVSFYLPCESLFYMRFSDLSELDVEEHKDALILFFNIAVFAEVTSSIAVAKQYFPYVSKSLVSSLTNLLSEELGNVWEQMNFTLNIDNLDELTYYAEQALRQIRRSIVYGNTALIQTSMDFIPRLVKVVKKNVPSLASKWFAFFLDDYTEERVPVRLQEALHPIICQRSSEICFKISAHMFGSIYSYPRPLALDEGRNIQVINLGTAYLKRNRRRVEGKLLLKIIDERFKHCEEYKGTIEEWLGRTSYQGGRTLSRALNDKNLRSKVHYHGVDCLMDLCTGDYSEMIRMVGEIFREAKIEPNSPVRRIDPAIQSRAIERVSREYLSIIRHIRPDGQKLHEIVDCFGNLSKNLLYYHELVGQGQDSKGNRRKDPYDLLNIYVDDFIQASRSSRGIWERLQKASILVDIGIAPSIRRVISDRATLRRIYCPAFRTTLTSSERLQLTKNQFEWFIDRPSEFCKDYLYKVTELTDQPTFWKKEEQEKGAEDITYSGPSFYPDDRDRIALDKRNGQLSEIFKVLQAISPLREVIKDKSSYDIFIGALGFEDRTTAAVETLAKAGVKVKTAVLFEYDRFYEAAEKKREKYEDNIRILTSGKAHRPFNAPITVQDPGFPQRFMQLLRSFGIKDNMRILFDCTSFTSLILSMTLSVLLDINCEMILLYSEAEEYFPTVEEWETWKLKPHVLRVRGPFAGVTFVAKPPILQADDMAELPVLLILFPTFNTERTDGVLADIDPAKRIWIFGEPHDLQRNAYRGEMAKGFAAPLIHPGDGWGTLTTFDYRETFIALINIYREHRYRNRIVIMPHGSKMQTLAVSIFASCYQVSQVFAMPKIYDPNRYSGGCLQVWCIPFGGTQILVNKLKAHRVPASL